jgi:Bifunctional DNA primase/polymerase, N-terminal
VSAPGLEWRDDLLAAALARQSEAEPVVIITDDMSTLEVALALAKAGIYVFPVDHPGLPQCAGVGRGHNPKTCEKRGKHPCVTWGEDATTDPKTITAWFTGASRNIGIHCGRSGLVVIDEDRFRELERYATEHGEQIPPTMVVTTAKGRHYYFRARPDRQLTNTEGAFTDYAINVRGHGGFVVGPGSVHKTGVVYTITQPLPVAPVPDWIITAVETRPTASTSGQAVFSGPISDGTGPTTPWGREALDGELAKLGATPEGHRNIQLNRSAYKIGQRVAAGEINSTEAEQALQAKAQEIDLDLGEILGTFRSGFYKGQQEPRSKKPLVQVREMSLEEMKVPSALEIEFDSGLEVTRKESTPNIKNNEGPGQVVTAATMTKGEAEFWNARPELQHIHQYARAHRVSPWAVLGCMLARVIAAIPPQVTLPALVGGPASLNFFVGLVGKPSAGKGSAVSASRKCIDLPHVDTTGPGSGEGLSHLFMHRKKDDEGVWRLTQHRTKILMYAPEIGTIEALKVRQASTLFDELNKLWFGEELSWSYVDPTKQLTVAEHSYRFCLIVGIQPGKARVILEDADSGTPQRFLWMPADDPDAPDIKPEEPRARGNPLWQPIRNFTNDLRPAHIIGVCNTLRQEVDQARLMGLRGQGNELDGHALMTQEKIAVGLMLLQGRDDMITEEDWHLAGIVRAVSDTTRQRVIDTLARTRAQDNRARGHAEAEREVMKQDRLRDEAVKRVSRSLDRKLAGLDWISHSELRKLLPSRDRQYFEDAIAALEGSGLVETRASQGDHAGHQGTEYRKVR